jgi:membrane protease YdiL (CAAX protease family)
MFKDPLNKLFPSTFLQAIALLLISLVLTSPVILIIKYFMKGVPLEFKLIPLYIAFFVIVIALSYAINKRKDVKNKIDFRIKTSPGFLVLAILTLITFQIGVNVPLYKILSFYFSSNYSIHDLNSIVVEGLGLIIAPIGEEIVFRGIIFKGFLNTYSPKKAIVISSVIFACMHGLPMHILFAFPLGLFFCWVYHKTGSMSVAIILHLVANLTSTGASYIMAKVNIFNTGNITELYGQGSIFIIGLCAIIFVFLFRLLMRKMCLNS